MPGALPTKSAPMICATLPASTAPRPRASRTTACDSVSEEQHAAAVDAGDQAPAIVAEVPGLIVAMRKRRAGPERRKAEEAVAFGHLLAIEAGRVFVFEPGLHCRHQPYPRNAAIEGGDCGIPMDGGGPAARVTMSQAARLPGSAGLAGGAADDVQVKLGERRLLPRPHRREGVVKRSYHG